MTKDLPTKEGYYWWIAKGKLSSTEKSILKVRKNKFNRLYADHGEYERYIEDWQNDEQQYWQYIPEPEIP